MTEDVKVEGQVKQEIDMNPRFRLKVSPENMVVPSNGHLEVSMMNPLKHDLVVRCTVNSMFFELKPLEEEKLVLKAGATYTIFIRFQAKLVAKTRPFSLYPDHWPEGKLNIFHYSVAYDDITDYEYDECVPPDLDRMSMGFELFLMEETDQTKQLRSELKVLEEELVKELLKEEKRKEEADEKKARKDNARKRRWRLIPPTSVLFKPQYKPFYLDQLDKMTVEEIQKMKEKEIEVLLKEEEKMKEKEREAWLREKKEREKKEKKEKAEKEEESKQKSKVKTVEEQKSVISFQRALENAKLKKKETACDPSENLKATPQKFEVKKPEEPKPVETVKVEEKKKNPVKAVAQEPKKKKKNPCCVIM